MEKSINGLVKIALLNSAYFDEKTGFTIAKLSTSNTLGYPNSVQILNNYGIISIPTKNKLCIISQHGQTDSKVFGILNSINDKNFSIKEGETIVFSEHWYNKTGNDGVYLQVAKSEYKAEAQMMGESTNKVISDLLQYILDLYEYLGILSTALNAHVHTGVQTGTGSSATIAVPFTVPPVPTNITKDKPYISNNKNLALTKNFQPYQIMKEIQDKIEELKGK
jgi:hypothetical protein